MADTPNLGLPAHKAPHEALQDALFFYAVGSDGAGADLIRGWPALVERVVADVAGGPWDELLCDLDDWCLDGNNIPFRYSVNFEDGYMAIYRVHDERAAALPSIREIALEQAARATVDTLDLYHSISEGGERYEQLRDALAMPTAQAGPEAAQLVLQAIKAVNALMNGRTPEEALAAGRGANLAIQSLALLAKPSIADSAARLENADGTKVVL
jgi:hypothetical protein